MAARFILNADDFGLTAGVNRAILELHQAGVISSATLMATGAAFDNAVAIALANPSLGVGCHITFTDGMPVSHPASIPSLIGVDGKHFRPSLADFSQALLRGQIREAEMEREALAQVRKLLRAGIDVTHLDTHKHTHIFPAVTRPLLCVAESTSIGAIRNPFEPMWSRSLAQGPFMRRLQVSFLDGFRRQFEAQRQIRNGYVITTQGAAGIAATGHLNERVLDEILTAAPDGLWEVVLHPGYNDAQLAACNTRLLRHRDVERDALLAGVPRVLAQPYPPALIHYGSLGSLGLRREMGIHTPDTGFDHA